MMTSAMRTFITTLSLLGSSVALSAASIQFQGNESLPLDELMDLRVHLGQKDGRFVPDPNGIPMTLDKVMPEYLSKDAVDMILRTVSAEYQDHEILAVRVDVTRSAYENALMGKDLVISITEGQIAEVRVVSMDPEVFVPTEVAERILNAAPLEKTDKLDGRMLDESVGLMNRFSPDYVQPVLVTGSEGDLEIEYRVAVGDRLGLSYGIDNYGSETTGEVRHSVSGEVSRVFTSADRIELGGTFSTDEYTYSARAEYFLPLDALARNRLRLTGYFSSFNSQDIGVALLDFSGETAGVIAGYERTLWSGDGVYLDWTAGIHFMHANQDNSSVGIQVQSADFLLPFTDLRLSRSTVDASWLAGLKMEGNLSGAVDSGDVVELARMGRLDADADFMIGTLFTGYRAYIDSVFSDVNRRAHEIIFTATAKSSFGSRLPANFLNVLGGHGTVRGYDVAEAAGDSSAYAQLDYRLHFNRYFPVEDSSSALRYQPRFPGDMPTLDLSLGAFTDFGYVSTVDEYSFENSGNLWSAGIGFYGKSGQYLSFSAEYGWGLIDYDTDSSDAEQVDGKFYFSIDLNY
jgi:hemolysin activation/secretion protein